MSRRPDEKRNRTDDGADQTIYTRGAVSGVGLPRCATDWSAADLPISYVREQLVSFMTKPLDQVDLIEGK